MKKCALSSLFLVVTMGLGVLGALPVWLPVFAITFAVFVGIASGAYPASRAAGLSPIKALKVE
jgi:ABC-type antimicrobial peptide transport system permease subunit